LQRLGDGSRNSEWYLRKIVSQIEGAWTRSNSCVDAQRRGALGNDGTPGFAL